MSSTAKHLFAAALVVPASCWAIAITEIHYHPDVAGDPDQRREFIEIYNESPVAVDLSGYFFSEGVFFAFPENTFLRARSYLVIAADAGRLKERYGLDNDSVVGNFSGRLDNGGER